MSHLEPIKLSMKDQVESLRMKAGHEAASHGFSSLYIWKEEMKLGICLEKDFFSVSYGLRGEHAWFFPCGDRKAVREWISCQIKEDELCFYYMRREDALFLEQEFPGCFEIRLCENDSEYLYDRKQQEKLQGRKFSGQRNHINRVLHDHRLRWERLCDENMDTAMEICGLWERDRERTGGIRDTEAVRNLLGHRRELSVEGILVYVDEEPYAVAAGYPLSYSTFDLALAKQKSFLTGLSVYVKHQLFLSLPEQYEWINAEEDLGIPGLRTMKRQMRPVGQMEMYTGRKKQDEA
ncbi:MAG: phosphatidylglycerol lysyltransferase domain-containing protein [Eubacteriales bacterium]|nr:phosphatidylglycerol lysyltransferase domain-containing protein [Eubacteriales bacterium]